MSTVIPKELAAARFIAANKRPYLALALFALTPLVRHGLETMAVDSKYRLYYDPVVLVKWNREQVAAVLLHEVGHILRKHSIRGQKINANSELWNQANDAEINDDLLDEGLDLPGSPITPSSLKVGIGNGRLAEEYYFALLKQQEQTNNQQQQSQQNNQQNQSQQHQQLNTNSQSQQSSSQGSQSSQGQKQQNQQAQSSNSASQSQEQGSLQPQRSSSSSSPNSNSNSKAQEQNGQAQGSNNTPTPDPKGNNPQLSSGNNSQQSTKDKSLSGSKEKPSPGSGRCGSCATGVKEDYEADELEAPGLNSIEQLALEEKVAKQILKASQTRGRVAGGWVRWANEKVNPKTDWRKELASLITASLRMTSGANDYSYSRPNRRQSVYGNIVMPSLVQAIPTISVVVDTSGSLNDRMMSQALAEIENIIKRTSQKIHLISCDARVHFSKQISSVKEAKLIGGGGTDLRVGIKEALETKPKPDVIIVITDGYTPWPSQPPKRTKLIAALTTPKMVPSWIKQVKLFD